MQLLKNWKFWTIVSSSLIVIASTAIVVIVISNKKPEQQMVNQPIATQAPQVQETEIPTEQPKEEVESDAKEVFKKYIEDNLESELGILPTNLTGTIGDGYHYGIENAGEEDYYGEETLRSTLQWDGEVEGILGADIADMDMDGTPEMTVFFTKKPDDTMGDRISYFYRVYNIINGTPKKVSEEPLQIDFSMDEEKYARLDEKDMDGSSTDTYLGIYKKEVDGIPYYILYERTYYASGVSLDEDTFFAGSYLETESWIKKEGLAALKYNEGKLTQEKAESGFIMYLQDMTGVKSDNTFWGEFYQIIKTNKEGIFNAEKMSSPKVEKKPADKIEGVFNRKLKKTIADKNEYWKEYGFEWKKENDDNYYYELNSDLIVSSEMGTSEKDRWCNLVQNLSDEDEILKESWNIVDNSITKDMR